jgi:hypothetical protein
MALSSPAQCSKHIETPATDTCSRCGRFACNECLSASTDLTRCFECVARDGGTEEQVPPWEQRAELGLVAAYIQTVKLGVTEPAKFWNQFPKKGPMSDAFFFGWINMALTALVAGLFFPLNIGPALNIYKSMPNMPAPLLRGIDFMQAHPFQMGAGYAATMIVLFPLIIVLSAGLYHLFLLPWSAGGSGFEATFRTACYANFANLAAGLPVIGLLAGIYNLVMLCWGFVKVHRTTTGRVIGALLTPMIIAMCCGCGLVVFAGFAAAKSKM